MPRDVPPEILLAGMLAAMLAAVAVTRSAPAWIVAANVVFHLLLLALVLRWPHARTGLLAGLPLGILYDATFLFRREATRLFDWVLETDTLKFLAEARDGVVLPRHVGMPLFTFPLETLDRPGTELLHLQSAWFGVVAVALLFALLRRNGVATRRALLVAWAFGFSLALWGVAGAVESFPISLVLLLLLHHLLLDGESRWKPACVTALALGVSLENVYFLPLVLVAFAVPALSRPESRRDLLALLGGRALAAGACIVLAILPLFAMLALARWQSGPGFYHTWRDDDYGSHPRGIVGYMDHYTRDYLQWRNLASPATHAGVAARVFLMSVKGQPARAGTVYTRRLDGVRVASPGNLLFVGGMGALATFAAAGWLRRLRREGPPIALLAALLATIVASRHAMILVFRPAETAFIFAGPSVMALWAFVGLGLGGDGAPRSRARAIGIDALVAAIAILLVVSGARFFAAIR